jgi:hypothetical protein
MSIEDAWVEIVTAQPREDAEAAFAEWRRRQEQNGVRVPDEAVRKDLIAMGPGGGGCWVRYSVRADLR